MTCTVADTVERGELEWAGEGTPRGCTVDQLDLEDTTDTMLVPRMDTPSSFPLSRSSMMPTLVNFACNSHHQGHAPSNLSQEAKHGNGERQEREKRESETMRRVRIYNYTK